MTFGAATAEEARADKTVRHIRDDATGGDCIFAGSWNPATKACTLTADTTDLFSIDSDYITLDGGGHWITGTNTGLDPLEKGAGIAVNVVGRSGVTVRNINITRFDYAVDLVDTADSTITGVVATNNAWAGISLTRASLNTIDGNTISNNSIDTGICVGFSSDNNTITGNQVSATERGIFVHTTSRYNNISGNTLVNHTDALSFMELDTMNTVSGNTITSNGMAVIVRGGSSGNTFLGNTVSDNGTGFLLENVSDTGVYENEITGNLVQASVSGGSGNRFNRSIAEGGGNHWDDFDAPAEGCIDSDGDGFCNGSYLFAGGRDDLPRADPASQNSGGDCQEPMLRLEAPNAYWASYNDYLERRLSANMALDNYGATPAYNVTIVITLNTNGVVTLTHLPMSLGAVYAGQSRPFSMQYAVPPGVQMFKSTLYTAATVGCETTYNYPDSAPIV